MALETDTTYNAGQFRAGLRAYHGWTEFFAALPAWDAAFHADTVEDVMAEARAWMSVHGGLIHLQDEAYILAHAGLE